jgi:hypothetical protein
MHPFRDYLETGGLMSTLLARADESRCSVAWPVVGTTKRRQSMSARMSAIEG